MSYSISATGSTKIEAKANIEVQFDTNVLNYQPIHTRDKAAALASANAMIDLLSDDVPENQVIHISLSGSVSWTGYPNEDLQAVTLTGASANAYAYFGAKK